MHTLVIDASQVYYKCHTFKKYLLIIICVLKYFFNNLPRHRSNGSFEFATNLSVSYETFKLCTRKTFAPGFG